MILAGTNFSAVVRDDGFFVIVELENLCYYRRTRFDSKEQRHDD